MHFSIVFSGRESCDLSYGMVFIGCPVWIRGERKVLSPHPNDPSYRRGDLRLSLAKESLAENLDAAQKQAVIIVHPSGHGSEDDLSALQDDMRDEGFAFRTLDFTLDRTRDLAIPGSA